MISDVSYPKVSIVLPIYNVSEYLRKSLNSLVKQTLQEIEIICINDGSTDNSLEIVKEYAKRDNRIVVVDKKNEGQGIARNLGINMAKGEYIGFVDPDDWVKPDMYEKMYNQAKKFSSEIVICDLSKYVEEKKQYVKFNFFKEAITPFKVKSIKISSCENLEKELINKTLLVSPCYSWNKIYKTNMLKSNEIFFSDSRCFEDCIFILKSHIIAKKISYISEVLYNYRIRKSSTLRSLSSKSKEALRTILDLKKYLQEKNLLDNFYYNLEWFIVMNTIYHYKDFPFKDRKKHLHVLSTLLHPITYNELKQNLRRQSIKNMINSLYSVSYDTKKNKKIISIMGIKFKFENTKISKTESTLIDILAKQKFYPKDTYLLYDNLYDAKAECIDAYSLFCYMRKKGIKAYYVLLKSNELYKKLAKKNELDGIIALSSNTEYGILRTLSKALLQTKCILTSFGTGGVKIEKFLKENPHWKYIFLQHGQIYIETRVMGTYITPTKYDKVIVSSENEKNIFLKNGWTEEQLIKAGLSRWDLLNFDHNNEKSILFMFTWRKMHQQRFDHSLYKKKILSLLYNEDLQNYLKNKNIKLYYAHHHALKHNMNVDFIISHHNINVVDNTKISEYAKKCSMLVTDFSSLSFDFMFQNKPVIYYPMDNNDKFLSYSEQIDLDCFCNMNQMLPNILFDENDVIEKIKYYVEHHFAIERDTKKKYNNFFYLKENIRQNLVDKLEKECPNVDYKEKSL